jgi:hypothetical protein
MGRTLRFMPAACLALAVLALAGCTPRNARPATAASLDDLWRQYAQALDDARVPKPDHLSRRLVALVRSTDGLTWNDQGQILMVAFTRQQYYQGTVGTPYTNTFGATWVTAAPFLHRFCQSLHLQGDALRLRIAQRLGLPPTSQNDAFVEMWVDPRIFFRPCADPEVTDGECQLNLTTALAEGAACPWANSYESQTSSAFTQVSQDHLAWMCTWWSQAYTGDPQKSYPWTALGYTYDWGNPRGIQGESEFVIPQDSTMVIESVTPLDQYCGGEPVV